MEIYAYVLCAFAKLRKATIRSVTHVCQSVFIWNNLATTGLFTRKFKVGRRGGVWKPCREASSFIKIWLYMITNLSFWSYLAQFFLEREMFQTKVVEKIKTHILCSVTVFRKSCRLWDNLGKYSRARQTTDHNITRRMRFRCCVTTTRIQTHTQNI